MNIWGRTLPFPRTQYELVISRHYEDFYSFLQSASDIHSVSLAYIPKSKSEQFTKQFGEKIDSYYPNLNVLKLAHSFVNLEIFRNLFLKTNLSRIKNLELVSININDENMEKILSELKFLEVLTLKNNKSISDKTLKVIKDCKFKLKSLDLNNCLITDEGIDNMDSDSFSDMQYLNLSKTHISLLNGFNNNFFLKNIRSLDISYNKLNLKSILNLLESEFFYKLSYLDISHNESYQPKETFSEILEILINKETQFSCLTHLAMTHNYLIDTDISNFLNSKSFPSLIHLNLQNNNIKISSLASISNELLSLSLENCEIILDNLDKVNFSNLKSLNLNNVVDLGDEGLAKFSKYFSDKIEFLSLANCNLTSDAILFLNEKAFIKGINLRGNLINDDGAQLIIRSKFFYTLEYLGLNECDLTEGLIEVFKGIPEKPKIQDLRLGGNRLNSSTMTELARIWAEWDDLKRLNIGSWECLNDFEGRKEMEARGVEIVPMIGDDLD